MSKYLETYEAEVQDLVCHATEWMPISEIPYASQKHNTARSTKDWWNNLFAPKEEDNHRGIYQVSLKKPKNFLHKDIGYIGKSDYIPYRVYTLKSSASSEKTTHHQCGRYLRFMGYKPEDVFVRVLFIQDRQVGVIEDIIHSRMNSEFKYEKGFAWAAASGGPASSMIRAYDSIGRISDVSQLEHLEQYIKQRKATL